MVVEADAAKEEAGIELVPEIVPTRALLRNGGRIPVSVRNIISHLISLKPRMVIGKVSAATPVVEDEVVHAWEEIIKAQIARWKKMFSKNDFDVGCARSTQHQIRLTEDKPFRERARRMPLCNLENLQEQLAELKISGIIKESRSPYASPVAVVRKKNGSLHMCIDYRSLNYPRSVHNPSHRRSPTILIRGQMVQCTGFKEWLLPDPHASR